MVTSQEETEHNMDPADAIRKDRGSTHLVTTAQKEMTTSPRVVALAMIEVCSPSTRVRTPDRNTPSVCPVERSRMTALAQVNLLETNHTEPLIHGPVEHRIVVVRQRQT
jgi:hypothetical protein